MAYLIDDEFAQKLLNYLTVQPYHEVYEFVEVMRSWKRVVVENKKVPDSDLMVDDQSGLGHSP